MRAAAHCGGAWYPIADTVSTLAGLTWVYGANQLEEDSVSRTYTATPQGLMLQSTSGGTSYQWMRIAGYAIMGVFGASSIYGYVVEAKCAALRDEVAERRSQSGAPPPARANPPSNIAGFTFGMSEADAEQVCAKKQEQWQLRGSVASCLPPQPGSTALPVRLEFELGTLHRIVALHRSSPQLIAQHYDALYTALRSMYESPQREPPR